MIKKVPTKTIFKKYHTIFHKKMIKNKKSTGQNIMMNIPDIHKMKIKITRNLSSWKSSMRRNLIIIILKLL